MRKILINLRAFCILFFIVFILLFSVYFLIKQPLLSNYKYGGDELFSEKYFSNEIKLKEHVKFLSEINRTSQDGQEKVIKYILEEL